MNRPKLDRNLDRTETFPCGVQLAKLTFIMEGMEDILPLFNFLSIVAEIAQDGIARLAVGPKDDTNLQEGNVLPS